MTDEGTHRRIGAPPKINDFGGCDLRLSSSVFGSPGEIWTSHRAPPDYLEAPNRNQVSRRIRSKKTKFAANGSIKEGVAVHPMSCLFQGSAYSLSQLKFRLGQIRTFPQFRFPGALRPQNSLLIPCFKTNFANFGQNSMILRRNLETPCFFPCYSRNCR